VAGAGDGVLPTVEHLAGVAERGGDGVVRVRGQVTGEEAEHPAPQLTQGHRGLPGQRVPVTDDYDEGLFAERPFPVLGAFGQAAGQDGVDAFLPQRVVEVGRPSLAYFDLDAWVFFRHRREEAGQRLVRGAGDVAEPDEPGLASPGPAGRLDHFVGVGEHPPRRLGEHPAGLGEPGRTPFEQPDAQLAFKVANLPAERRLRHVQPLGGALEPAFVGDRDDVPHETQLDHHVPHGMRPFCRRAFLDCVAVRVAVGMKDGDGRVGATGQDEVMDRIGAAITLGRRGDRADARERLTKIWTEISTDAAGGAPAGGDAFHRCVLAHYLADLHDEPREELAWDLRALEAAGSLTDERVQEHHVSLRIRGFYPSLHLNLADVYRRLGEPAKAREHLAEAERRVDALGDDAYGEGVRAALARLSDRLAEVGG
jgi:hypothetical protein